eukprot:1531057-Amphidinium_carterae.1
MGGAMHVAGSLHYTESGALRSDVHLDGDLTTRFQSEISILRTDVMDVASVVNLLHDRVDELSEGPGLAYLCCIHNHRIWYDRFESG